MPEPPEEAVPVGMPGQQVVVQHVRRGQQVVGVRAGPDAIGYGSVAVHHGGAHAAQAQRRDQPELVGGQRAGRRDVQRGAALEHGGQRRDQVAERLTRRGAGGDDHVAALAGQPRGPGLVGPRPRRADAVQRLAQPGGQPVRPVGPPSAARGDPVDMRQPAGVGPAAQDARLGHPVQRHVRQDRTGRAWYVARPFAPAAAPLTGASVTAGSATRRWSAVMSAASQSTQMCQSPIRPVRHRPAQRSAGFWSIRCRSPW